MTLPDPDRALKGDLPINAMSMLEIVSDVDNRARAQIRAAKRMMAVYALRAIVNGEDPVAVMKACNFDLPAPGATLTVVDAFGNEHEVESPMSTFFTSIMGGPPSRPDAKQRFITMLHEEIRTMIEEAFDR